MSDLIKTPFRGADIDLEIWLKDNSLNYRAEIVGPHGIVIADNKFSGLHQLWDSNSSTNAFEIVNELYSPLFQFIRESDSKLTVRGVFETKDGVRVLTDKNSRIIKNFDYHRDAVPGLKAMFKYPAWKYPGQYADQ